MAAAYPQVGERFGFFTVEGVRPLVLRCDCGKEVRGRTPFHLSRGLKSCGCRQHASKPLDEAYVSPEMAKHVEVLRLLDASHPEHDAHVFLVRCKVCTQIRLMNRSSLRHKVQKKFGCRKCWGQTRKNST